MSVDRNNSRVITHSTTPLHSSSSLLSTPVVRRCPVPAVLVFWGELFMIHSREDVRDEHPGRCRRRDAINTTVRRLHRDRRGFNTRPDVARRRDGTSLSRSRLARLSCTLFIAQTRQYRPSTPQRGKGLAGMRAAVSSTGPPFLIVIPLVPSQRRPPRRWTGINEDLNTQGARADEDRNNVMVTNWLSLRYRTS